MSFYLVRHDPDGTASDPEIAALAEKHGFRPSAPVRAAGWRLDLFDNASGNGVHRHRTGQDRVLASVGLFLYGGHAGAEALAACDADRRAGRDWRSRTHGHFTLLDIGPDRIELLCDGAGAHKLYHDRDRHRFSNSFLALLACEPAPRFDRLGVYHYAFNGALHGDRTLIEGIAQAPAGSKIALAAETGATDLPSLVRPGPEIADIGMAEAVDLCLAPLRGTIGDLGRATRGKVRLSMSGGFDSRLLLALMIEAGIRPELYVYGGPDDTDVRVARAVAAHEGLVIRHVDKSLGEPPAPADMPAILERNLAMFDGWKNDGLFDNGNDAPDRMSRHEDGFVPVNGGLGEIFRNFFNLRNRSYRADEIVDAFYRQYCRHWTTDRFDEDAYRADMKAAIVAQCHETGPAMGPQQAQLLYALFRGRFWTARDAENNQRFGAMAFPFIEHDAICAAARIPLRLKAFGKLQAAMISSVNPGLAGLPSSYGFAFDKPFPPGWYAASMKSLLRPVRLRPWLWRTSRRPARRRPLELTPEHLAAAIDPAMPAMASCFRIEALDDVNLINRVATLEYLAARHAIAVG